MTLKWSIDQALGRLAFGKLIPMAGGTYSISVSGQTSGTTYVFYVMDETAENCLARSTCTDGAYSIAFNQTELRKNFEKHWHEIRTFHTVVSDGANTIAEGDLPIQWNPVWTEPTTGAAYSMKGPQGVAGESAGFGTPGANATTLAAGSEATASVAASGPDSGKVFTFDFGIPRGAQGFPGTDGDDGVSPAVTISEKTGGHRVTITDRDHPSGQSFDVMDGEDGNIVSVSPTGTATDEVQYITIDGTEKKLAGGEPDAYIKSISEDSTNKKFTVTDKSDNTTDITAAKLGALTSHQDITGKQDKLAAGDNITIANYKWTSDHYTPAVAYTASLPTVGNTVTAYSDAACTTARTDFSEIKCTAANTYAPWKGDEAAQGTITLNGTVVSATNIAIRPYDETHTYAAGDYCYYNDGFLYPGVVCRCLSTTTGTFDDTKWTMLLFKSYADTAYLPATGTTDKTINYGLTTNSTNGITALALKVKTSTVGYIQHSISDQALPVGTDTPEQVFSDNQGIGTFYGNVIINETSSATGAKGLRFKTLTGVETFANRMAAKQDAATAMQSGTLLDVAASTTYTAGSSWVRHGGDIYVCRTTHTTDDSGTFVYANWASMASVSSLFSSDNTSLTSTAQAVSDNTAATSTKPAAGAASVSLINHKTVPIDWGNNTTAKATLTINFTAAGTSGQLRYMELLITNVEKDATLGALCGLSIDTTTYTVISSDSTALKPEEGTNLLIFAEYETNKFIVSRQVLSSVSA